MGGGDHGGSLEHNNKDSPLTEPSSTRPKQHQTAPLCSLLPILIHANHALTRCSLGVRNFASGHRPLSGDTKPLSARRM